MQPEEKAEKTSEISQKEGEGEARVYELGYLIIPSISEESLPGEVGIVKGLLEKYKTIVIGEEFPKIRDLSYAMRKGFGGKYQKYNSAYFGWVKFDTDPSILVSLKEDLDKNSNILRYMIIKTVRESTLANIRPVFKREEVKEEKSAKKEKVKKPVSEAELDKTIEELIVE